jgi:hypothetical protein
MIRKILRVKTSCLELLIHDISDRETKKEGKLLPPRATVLESFYSVAEPDSPKERY